MKIRNGFVSNSSSSSFVVAIPKDKGDGNSYLSVGWLQQYLFPDQDEYPNPYPWDSKSPLSWPTNVIAAIVYRDIVNSKKYTLSVDDICSELQSGSTEDDYKAEVMVCEEFGIKDTNTVYYLPQQKREEIWNRQEEVHKELSKQTAKQFVENNPDHEFFRVSYSDNDGELFSAMEHGDLFDRISHLKISHH